MALQFLQQEVDYIFNLLFVDTTGEGNKYLRNLLPKEAHRCTVDKIKIAKDLLIHEDKGQRAFSNESKKLLNEFSSKLLDEFKNHPEMPRKVGDSKAKGSRLIVLNESTASKLIFTISGTSNNYNQFKNLNDEINLQVIKSENKFLSLFGFKTTSEDKDIKKRLGKLYNIGHESGQAVVNKKILATEGAIFGGGISEDGEVFTPEILLEEVPELRKIQDEFSTLKAVAKMSANHSQTVRIKEGSLVDRMTISVSIEGKSKNQSKATFEQSLTKGNAKTGQKGLSSIIRDAQKLIKSLYSDAKKNTRRARSSTPIEIVGGMIVNTPLKRAAYKTKRAKNLTQFKLVPTSKKPIRASKEKTFSSSGTKSGAGPTAFLRKKLPRAVKNNRQSSNVDLQRQAFLTRAFVNSRLSQVVESNMGPPRLTNRTGRFASSVRVENMAATPSGIVQVDYTYQQNPYKVFEEGNYSSFYDPRPLIENSIRELAIQKLQAKFVMRRVS